MQRCHGGLSASRTYRPTQYLTVRVTRFDTAGDHAGAIATLRALRAASPSADLPTVGLALGLARFGGQAGIDEAEALLGQVRVVELSEMAAGGHLFGRGSVAAARGQHATASRHFQEAQRQFAQNPMTLGLLSEIGGYHALTLREAGDIQGATAKWTSVLPVLRAQPGLHPLLRAWG